MSFNLEKNIFYWNRITFDGSILITIKEGIYKTKVQIKTTPAFKDKKLGKDNKIGTSET